MVIDHKVFLEILKKSAIYIPKGPFKDPLKICQKKSFRISLKTHSSEGPFKNLLNNRQLEILMSFVKTLLKSRIIVQKDLLNIL